jgi:hypothetical protein
MALRFFGNWAGLGQTSTSPIVQIGTTPVTYYTLYPSASAALAAGYGNFYLNGAQLMITSNVGGLSVNNPQTVLGAFSPGNLYLSNGALYMSGPTLGYPVVASSQVINPAPGTPIAAGAAAGSVVPNPTVATSSVAPSSTTVPTITSSTVVTPITCPAGYGPDSTNTVCLPLSAATTTTTTTSSGLNTVLLLGLLGIGGAVAFVLFKKEEEKKKKAETAAKRRKKK